MQNAYRPDEIEARCQETWERERTFRAPNPGDPDFDSSRPKYYVLDMFPYPSGAGLHVGHPTGYVGSDIVARRKRMEGFNVLHPMGFDAFGLPAEQYAIKSGRHPEETTRENIANFLRQLKAIGLSYDWDRQFATCDVEFYRWTQWIFARLFERGLAYQAEASVWWCEELKTVLANEEVINGRSERGDHPCERRPLKQWMLKITAYAERLLADLESLDWPESVKAMQREWIGKSEGAEIEFPVEGHEAALTVFTTRPDTIYGATFMVVAPEHALVEEVTTAEQRAAVEEYVKAAGAKSDLERTDLAKQKTGVFTGAYCLNPAPDVSDKARRIPIWVADYVLASYGTGAIMAVPGQDERDWEFAETFDLNILRTVEPTPDFDGKAFTGEGPAINSGFLNGMGVAEAKAAMIAWLEKEGAGRARTTYRLRDWLFSRQRYWGEPFPVLHTEDGRVVRVPDEDLPVELPAMENFEPSSDGSAPLARATDWVKTTAPDGTPATRDTDTMPGWAGSCWYYLRFMDPKNSEAAFSEAAERYWGPVDLYIGGAEHAVLHLLYARFWHKVLFDAGLVHTEEPFQKLFNQGMVQAFAYKDSSGRLVPADEVEERDGTGVAKSSGEELEQVVAKMSKSLHNVVNPDEVIAEFGADTFRLYEMYMGPLGDAKPWNPRDVIGCRRFLDRVWRLYVDTEGTEPVRPNLVGDHPDDEGDSLALEKALHRAVRQADDSFRHFNFNTAIAGFMTFVNEATKRSEAFTRSQASRFAQVIHPFVPHVAEELWSRLGHTEPLAFSGWPEVDEAYLVDDEIDLVVQIKGKVRGRTKAPREASQGELEALAREAIADHLEGAEVVKTIVVPGKLVNFVVK